MFLQLHSQACHGAVGSSIQQSATQCLLNLTMTRNTPLRRTVETAMIMSSHSIPSKLTAEVPSLQFFSQQLTFSQSEYCVNREYTCAIFPFPDYVQQTTLASFRHRSVKEGRSYLRRETKRFNVWVGHKKGGVLCADDWGILITTRWQSAPMTSGGLASHNNASSRRCNKKTPQFMRF